MEIIVQGHKIDTKDIWDIQLISNSREVCIIINIIDKQPIKIHRNIPYETYSSEYPEYRRPYEKLYKEVKEKWEADKSALPVFKL